MKAFWQVGWMGVKIFHPICCHISEYAEAERIRKYHKKRHPKDNWQIMLDWWLSSKVRVLRTNQDLEEEL